MTIHVDLQVDGLPVPAGQHVRGDQPLAVLVALLHRDLGHIGLLPRQPGTASSGAANRANPDDYSKT
jgi:hypothetical protein